jgi:hypothetical protein
VRLLSRVAPEAQEARFLIGSGETALGIVRVTRETGRDLRWDRAQLESAHELGEDWWMEMEEQFINEEAARGDVVALRLPTRKVAYRHRGHATSPADGKGAGMGRDG